MSKTGSDAHDPSWVGKFDLAYELLEKLKIDEKLILNNDIDKLKKFIRISSHKSIL